MTAKSGVTVIAALHRDGQLLKYHLGFQTVAFFGTAVNENGNTTIYPKVILLLLAMPSACTRTRARAGKW